MPSLADVTHEWERHHRQGHLTKLPSCPACQRESGPRIVHKRTKASERKIGVLHGDLAHMGPGLNKFLWVLVLAAVVEVDDILTVVPFYYPLEIKASERVLTCVKEVILWIRNAQYCSGSTAGRFIQRFMSDNRGEFTSKPFTHGMHKLGVTLTTAPSYQPQSNGMAERCVGLIKTAVRRLLVAANLGDRFWLYVVHFAAQLQQAKALGCPWDQPMFGELVATRRLKTKADHSSTEPRVRRGRSAHDIFRMRSRGSF
eukprot:66397-Amphidinium_carterae.1